MCNITEKEYLEAQKIIIEYLTEQSNKPVTNPDLFYKTIKERVETCNEVLEHANYISYELDPIGGREGIFDIMKKGTLEEIIEVILKLEEIRKSICSC